MEEILTFHTEYHCIKKLYIYIISSAQHTQLGFLYKKGSIQSKCLMQVVLTVNNESP